MQGWTKALSSRSRDDSGQARLQHLMAKAKRVMGHAGLGQSNHWHVQDLWLGEGPVREL